MVFLCYRSSGLRVSVTHTLFRGIFCYRGSGLQVSVTHTLFRGISLLPRLWPSGLCDPYGIQWYFLLPRLWPSGLSDPYGIQWYFSATAAVAFGSL